MKASAYLIAFNQIVTSATIASCLDNLWSVTINSYESSLHLNKNDKPHLFHPMVGKTSNIRIVRLWNEEANEILGREEFLGVWNHGNWWRLLRTRAPYIHTSQLCWAHIWQLGRTWFRRVNVDKLAYSTLRNICLGAVLNCNCKGILV
jgi:hypothetical protein